MDKEYITHIRKDNLNRIIEFKTNKGNVYDFEMAKDEHTLSSCTSVEPA